MRPSLSKMVQYVLIGLLFANPLLVFGSTDFNHNYILSDDEIGDYQSTSLGGIQKFLETKGGTLGYFITEDAKGSLKTAAEIIYLAALEHKINPQALLTLAQKEQSLLTDRTPTQGQYDWAMGYALCDKCSPDDSKIVRFKGFGKQINSSAAQIRYYLDNPHELYFKPEKKYKLEGYTLKPVNLATASLYNYTPHIIGNKNFWKIWTSWFSRKQPDGSLLRVKNEKTVWLIQNGEKRAIKSKSVLLSRFDENKIREVSAAHLNLYEEGAPIKFAQFSLLRNGSAIYLLVNDTIRPFESKTVFRKLGFQSDEIIAVDKDDLKDYKEGQPITADTSYVTGMLLQNKKTGGVYWVQNGVKQPILDRIILILNFRGKKILGADPQTLEQYKTGGPVVLQDGELITSPNTRTIYVVSEGKKRPISSPETFKALGYQWDKVLTIPHKIVELHPDGEIIE
ncbi:MAG: hypothetical protein HY602_03075 [Parcubacteria group bacterium]|nr:hypothetical protein [Parcubacteria group bacterium]